MQLLPRYRLVFRNRILIAVLTGLRLLSTIGIIRLLIVIRDRILTQLVIVTRLVFRHLIVTRDQISDLNSNSISRSN